MTEQSLSGTAPDDKYNDEEGIVPTISFEYDLSWCGDNYSKTFGSVDVYIPVAFIEEVEKEIPDEDEANRVAFEKYTGFHRCHLIHWSTEVSEAYGDGQSDQALHEQEVYLATWRKAHYPTCGGCSNSRYARLVEQ